ncbi:helix-turn-helix transcriptional regulator [Streptacidiphilus sp. P02-A3a]|nr:helix-turn-helix transcriptional regulator [Streptacidiphilus sp. P02-A3a]
MQQQELAAAANVSYSLLTKVETANRQPTPAFIAACARALLIDPQALTSASYIGPNGCCCTSGAGRSAPVRPSTSTTCLRMRPSSPAPSPPCGRPSPPRTRSGRQRTMDG